VLKKLIFVLIVFSFTINGYSQGFEITKNKYLAIVSLHKNIHLGVSENIFASGWIYIKEGSKDTLTMKVFAILDDKDEIMIARYCIDSTFIRKTDTGENYYSLKAHSVLDKTKRTIEIIKNVRFFNLIIRKETGETNLLHFDM
jgi:hypothetical protein